MSAPTTTTRQEIAANVTRDLYNCEPAIAAGYLADLKTAADTAAAEARRAVAVARERHDMYEAARALAAASEPTP